MIIEYYFANKTSSNVAQRMTGSVGEFQYLQIFNGPLDAVKCDSELGEPLDDGGAGRGIAEIELLVKGPGDLCARYKVGGIW